MFPDQHDYLVPCLSEIKHFLFPNALKEELVILLGMGGCPWVLLEASLQHRLGLSEFRAISTLRLSCRACIETLLETDFRLNHNPDDFGRAH